MSLGYADCILVFWWRTRTLVEKCFSFELNFLISFSFCSLSTHTRVDSACLFGKFMCLNICMFVW